MALQVLVEEGREAHMPPIPQTRSIRKLLGTNFYTKNGKSGSPCGVVAREKKSCTVAEPANSSLELWEGQCT
eukprot:COSAG01_NODE_4452_length_5007_cov_1.898737_4_plen_72_part_00